MICDVTRPVPNGLLLRPVIDRLIAGGVPIQAITIVVATGLHQPNLDEDLQRLIDDQWIFDHLKIVNHDANDASANTYLGETASGAAVALNRTFLEAEVRFVVGLVEPHFMAGYAAVRRIDGNPMHLE